MEIFLDTMKRSDEMILFPGSASGAGFGDFTSYGSASGIVENNSSNLLNINIKESQSSYGIASGFANQNDEYELQDLYLSLRKFKNLY